MSSFGASFYSIANRFGKVPLKIKLLAESFAYLDTDYCIYVIYRNTPKSSLVSTHIWYGRII